MGNKRYYLIVTLAAITSIVLSSCGLTKLIGLSPATPSTTPLLVTATPLVPVPSTTTNPVLGDYSNSSGGQVEVLSLWSTSSGKAGLAALANVLGQMYPNINFVDAGAGTTGTDPNTFLANRLAAGNPPDSWQANAGQDTMANYVATNEIQPLDSFFLSTGLSAELPPSLLSLISQNGHYYNVPIDIRRSNVLWYNPQVLQAAGITLDPHVAFPDWNAFFATCDKIKAAGKTCLAIGPASTTMLLFENVMIGTIGSDQWNGLWTTPPTTDWNGPQVKAGIVNFAKVLSYTNKDAASIPDWQSTAKLVANGDAAFAIMDDSVYEYFTTSSPDGLGLKPHTNFDWAVSPGNYGIFDFHSDSYVMPAKPKNIANSTAWLSTVASRSGQEAFNPLNGSICARKDCDPSLFNEYSQGAAKDWGVSKLAGSLSFGVVAAPAWVNSIQDAINQFLPNAANLSAQAAFQKALAAACTSNGVCK